MVSAFSQAWGSWKTAAGVALIAVIAFAVGIGATTAIFTIINGVLLRPLPYPNSERFVAVSRARTDQPGPFFAMSVPELHDYQQHTTSFDVFGWFRGGRFNLSAPGDPQFVRGVAVTPDLARQLGSPVLGQWFSDDTSAVLSSALWQRLGGRQDIIGSAITLDDRRYTVTGVMPPAFRFPIASLGMGRGDTEVWIPLDPSPPDANRSSGGYFAYARRKPGVSLDQARADAKRVAAAIAATNPGRYQFYTADVVGLRESMADILRAPLLILLGGAALLLLIACANVATLLLARSVVRARETAVRVALGASRRHLALQYFAEGALVSVAGAAAGVGLSAIFVRQILSAAAEFVPRPDLIAIDWKVLGFSVTLAVTTGVVAGLAPLWQASRTTPNSVLTDAVRASTGAPARRLSQGFVVAEIALAFTLLTTSAILVVHLRNLAHVPLGYTADGLLTFNVALPRSMAENARRVEQDRLIAALRQTPGVTSAAFASQLPALCGGGSTAVYAEGRPPGAPGQQVCVVLTTPEFMSTLRIPLSAGRWLNQSDDSRRDPLTVVVNEAAARAYWPGRNPIGASGRLSQADGDRFEIVGVVGDVRNKGLKRPPEPELYLSASRFGVNPMNVVVRSELPSDQVVAATRRVIRQTNPTLVMENVRTMNDVVRETVQLDRLSSLVMRFFALAALFMATLGIYGVLSYFVRQRTVELGTRMALGAVNHDLVALVLGGGLKLSLAGMAVGSIAVAGAVSLLVRYLEVANFGWLPFAASTAVVGFVAAAGAAVPAWRTTLISPMAAIREQPPSVWQWARQRMQSAVHDIREAVVGNEGEGVQADVLTAFVEAARSTDSYDGALRAVLASVCEQLRVESAALFGRHDGLQDYRRLVATGALTETTLAVAADGFLITRLRAYPRPLAFAPSELAALAEWAAVHRPERVGEIHALAAAGVSLAVPLHTRREILGVLLLSEPDDSRGLTHGRPRGRGFSADEKQVLRIAADQFALMIENARLTDRVIEQETLRRDIALASDVQRRLLPDAPPHVDCADFAAASVAARRIGGDYYDFLELGGGEIGIAMADVSGKGVAAALIMSVVQASLRIISSESYVSPPRLVARMNEFVYRSTPASKYATFFFGQLDQKRRQLRYVNAGHNPPYLVRAARRLTADGASDIEELSVGGTVVGMFPEMDYEEATIDLYAGDVLLAFTDGIPEAHNPENEEFGEERLQQLLRQTAHLSADEIAARISSTMKGWIRDAEQYDDLTFIVMKVR